MKQFKFTALSLILLGSMTAVQAQAEPWSVGASLIYSESPYRGGQDRYLPIPVVNYEGEDFWLRSLQAGYYLWKTDQDQLSLTLLGSPQQYDPKDNDLGDMKALDKRRMTLMGGLTYRHSADWGTVRTTLVGDVLNNSNGILWDLTYLYRVQLGKLGLTPGIGALWNSSNQNRYYFGVSGNESVRTGIDRYQPDDSWTPYVELTADYQFNAQWRGFVSGRYTRLPDEIKDSPMVDKNSQTLLWTGISYSF